LIVTVRFSPEGSDAGWLVGQVPSPWLGTGLGDARVAPGLALGLGVGLPNGFPNARTAAPMSTTPMASRMIVGL
jgi:hypothetical protein